MSWRWPSGQSPPRAPSKREKCSLLWERQDEGSRWIECVKDRWRISEMEAGRLLTGCEMKRQQRRGSREADQSIKLRWLGPFFCVSIYIYIYFFFHIASPLCVMGFLILITSLVRGFDYSATHEAFNLIWITTNNTLLTAIMTNAGGDW